MNESIKVPYSVFKSFVTTRNLSAQRLTVEGTRYLKAFDGSFSVICELIEAVATEECADYDANLASGENVVLSPRISNYPATRPATTKAGWHYCPRYITWTTALADSLHNKKVDLVTDWADATLKFWKDDGTELKRSDYLSDELFQAALTLFCTRTAMDWRSAFDFDIVGCTFLNGARLSPPTWAYVIAAPDIPAGFGGSVPFLDGGFPVHLLGDYNFIDMNGITVKNITADPVLNTNKFRMLIDHGAGTQIPLSMGFKIFKL